MATEWGRIPDRSGLDRGERALLAVMVLGTLAMLGFVGWVILAVVAPVLGLPFNQVEISLATQARVRDGELVVTGTTNLPDGVVLDWWVSSSSGVEALPEGSVVVQDGAFAFSVPAGSWVATRAEVTTEFTVGADGQPAWVSDRFGSQGERMIGPDVYEDSGDKYLSVTVRAELP